MTHSGHGLSVPIFFPVGNQQADSNNQRCEFCGGNCQPDAVDTQEYRQNQYTYQLEEQRPQKGDNR